MKAITPNKERDSGIIKNNNNNKRTDEQTKGAVERTGKIASAPNTPFFPGKICPQTL